MPEGLEAEIWRRSLAPLVGRTVTEAWVDDRVADPRIVPLVPGCLIEGIRRRGKVVVIDTDGPSIGLHFGMTGRLIVDGEAPIEKLEYSSGADREDWDRLRLFTGGAAADGPSAGGAAAIRMNDPRRLGRISIDPELDELGVDVFDVDRHVLGDVLAGRRTTIKSALLDQHLVAGLGNLCADEVLWWAGVAPSRRVDSLRSVEITSLARAIRERLPIMLRRGGSTTGTLSPAVRVGPDPCPRDGGPMRRATIGGRAAVWCMIHQH